MTRRLSDFMLWAIVALAGGGCGTQTVLFGTPGQYLLNGYDQLATPGQTAMLRARLQAGDLLSDQPGHTIRFYRDGRLVAAAVTGPEGYAQVPYHCPDAGDYAFTAEAALAGFSQQPPEPVELLIACRPADAPLLIVDLDYTLVESGFGQVLLGEPAAMPDSPEVMQKLSGDYSVIYLTHRPEYFGPRSKQWLSKNGYPRAPVLLSDIAGFVGGSGQFKSTRLAEIKSTFANIRIGIGDKVSDAQAYHDNGIKAYLIVMPQLYEQPQGLLDLAEAIATLSPQVQVVTTWRQIERGIYDGESFPPDAMVQQLKERAAAMAATAPATEPASATQPATSPAPQGGPEGGEK